MPATPPRLEPFRSIPGVCDIEVVTKPGARPGLDDARPDLLIEVPHGATRRRDFEATRRRLVGEYPDDLEHFFYVNTDVGSIECARWIAEMVVNPAEYPELVDVTASNAGAARSPIDCVVIARGLVARTFVDLNRVAVSQPRAVEAAGEGPTPALPEYVTHPEDIEELLQMHGEYQALVARAYSDICGRPSTSGALVLHTYAPRVVEIDRLDDGIVAALRRAYQPEIYATLPRRPEVDLITEDPDRTRLAPENLARAVRAHYAQVGIEARENESYRLHPSTMGYVHSARYPGRVLSVEINRAALADPFTPFAEMSISEAKARRMAAPIAKAFSSSRRA